MAISNPGHRPAAFWELEFDGCRPSYFEERSFLWRHGMLTPEERNTLESEWKAEFQKAQAPDFSISTDDGLLHGDAAVQAHLRWADVPIELTRRWTVAARRRRPRAEAPKKALDVTSAG